MFIVAPELRVWHIPIIDLHRVAFGLITCAQSSGRAFRNREFYSGMQNSGCLCYQLVFNIMVVSCLLSLIKTIHVLWIQTSSQQKSQQCPKTRRAEL